MDYTSWQEIQKNEVVRKRLAKRIVRECFRDGEFENFHTRSTELDDEAVKEIMTDAVNRTHIFLSKLSNAMGDLLVERLKEQDDVPGWDDPEDAHLFGWPRELPCAVPCFMLCACLPARQPARQIPFHHGAHGAPLCLLF